MKVGILVLDTGCFLADTSPKVAIVKADFSLEQPEFPGIRPGYKPRKDGSDSKHGSGTDNCNRLAQLIGNDSNYKIFSLKVGDSGTPLFGTNPVAVLPGLKEVVAIATYHRDWKWVCFLNYNVAAVKEPAKMALELAKLSVPVVVTVGKQKINFGDFGALPSGFMSVAIDTDNSDFGSKLVTLAASDYMVAVAAVAKARFQVNDGSDHVINEVIKQAKPTDRWKNRSITGGVL